MKQGVQAKVLYNHEFINGWFSGFETGPGRLVLAETKQGVEVARVLTDAVPLKEEKENKYNVKIIRAVTEKDMKKVGNFGRNVRIVKLLNFTARNENKCAKPGRV